MYAGDVYLARALLARYQHMAHPLVPRLRSDPLRFRSSLLCSFRLAGPFFPSPSSLPDMSVFVFFAHDDYHDVHHVCTSVWGAYICKARTRCLATDITVQIDRERLRNPWRALCLPDSHNVSVSAAARAFVFLLYPAKEQRRTLLKFYVRFVIIIFHDNFVIRKYTDHEYTYTSFTVRIV